MSSSIWAAQEEAKNKLRIIIKADALFDPVKGFIEDASVLVENGFIDRVFGGEDFDGIEKIVTDNPLIHIVEFREHFISPPFCDYHLHFPLPASSPLDTLRNSSTISRDTSIAVESDRYIESQAKSNGNLFDFEVNNHQSGLGTIVNQLKRCGIASAYEAGDKRLAGLQIKSQIKNDVDLNTSGYALYKSGGYGSFLGRAISKISEAKSVIDELCRLKVDFIKVINSGILDPKTGTITPGGFDANELAAIIEHAIDKGLAVHCHANGDNAIRECIEAGSTAIVHGFFASDETLDLMVSRNVSFIPTIAALKRLELIYDDPVSTCSIGALVDRHSDVVRRAFKKGVRVLPGSDSGPDFIPYGTAYLEELKLLMRAGLTFSEVLSRAVADPLQPGKPANFMILPFSLSESFADHIEPVL
ncbi:MAG: amidohydrolase family protein [Rubrobacteridae bacterium]|nr:amidohydrolase family protein [Rubrobacteridae bacterium]